MYIVITTTLITIKGEITRLDCSLKRITLFLSKGAITNLISNFLMLKKNIFSVMLVIKQVVCLHVQGNYCEVILPK